MQDSAHPTPTHQARHPPIARTSLDFRKGKEPVTVNEVREQLRFHEGSCLSVLWQPENSPQALCLLNPDNVV